MPLFGELVGIIELSTKDFRVKILKDCLMNQSTRLILQSCESNDPEKQFQAVLQVEDLDLIEAIPILIKLLSSGDIHVRSASVSALTSLGSSQANSIAPVFVEHLDDSDELIRCDLIDALAELCYEPSIETLLLLLNSDPSYLVRATAAEALADIAQVGDDKVLKELEKSLNDDCEAVRSYSAYAIGLIGSDKYLTIIKDYVAKEESIKVKAKLFAAAYRLGDENSIKGLLNLLRGKDEESIFVVVNTFKQLAEEIPPKSLTSYAILIEKKLSLTQQRFPSLANEVNTTLEMINLINS